MKIPKKKRSVEEKTVLILSCDGKYALEKRPEKGLLSGLWQFPNIPGKQDLPEVLYTLEKLGLRPREILRQVERRHIFTHIQWEMRGFYAEVWESGGDYAWMTADQIRQDAALPTAFRLFWDEITTGG